MLIMGAMADEFLACPTPDNPWAPSFLSSPAEHAR